MQNVLSFIFLAYNQVSLESKLFMLLILEFLIKSEWLCSRIKFKLILRDNGYSSGYSAFEIIL